MYWKFFLNDSYMNRQEHNMWIPSQIAMLLCTIDSY